MASGLPVGWTSEDIQFLIEKVKGWPIVLVEDQALGIPTIQNIPDEAISDWGYSVLKATTEQYDILYEVQQSPSGNGWAHIDVLSGVFPYNKAAVIERLASLIEARAENPIANAATPVLKSEELVEPQEHPELEKANALPVPGTKEPIVKTLAFREEGKRLIAFNETWLAICCCSVDRETGEIRYGQWRMYHTNFLGVLDPVTGQQICGTNVEAVMKRAGEIYGVKVELEGVPSWIMPSMPAVSASPLPSPITPPVGLTALEGLGGRGS